MESIRQKRLAAKGSLKGKVWMADDFDAPLEEMKEYEGVYGGMRCLPDTRTIIWYFEHSNKLSQTAEKIIDNPENTILNFSIKGANHHVK